MNRILKNTLLSIGLLASASASSVALADNVRVLNAKDVHFGASPICGNGGGEIATIEVEVENIAYDKEITLHWKSISGAWTTTSASYVTSVENTNKEIWSASTECRFDNDTVQFAVQYSVNGMEFWDNNNGNNFTVAVNAPLLLEQPVLLEKAATGTGGGCYGMCGYFYGEVIIGNVVYDKIVNITYSINGSEWRSLHANFNTSLDNNTERWSWGINTGSSSDTVKFAIEYVADGQSYWDNNHGQDYTAN